MPGSPDSHWLRLFLAYSNPPAVAKKARAVQWISGCCNCKMTFRFFLSLPGDAMPTAAAAESALGRASKILSRVGDGGLAKKKEKGEEAGRVAAREAAQGGMEKGQNEV